MNKLILVMLFLFVVGCASTSSINMARVISESITLSGSQNVNVINIPSHGAMGDSLAMAAGGGANATKIKKTIEQLSDAGGGTLVITSTNAELAKVNVVSALKDVYGKTPNIFLIYAGSEKYSNEVREAAEEKGVRYAFVDAYRK